MFRIRATGPVQTFHHFCPLKTELQHSENWIKHLQKNVFKRQQADVA